MTSEITVGTYGKMKHDEQMFWLKLRSMTHDSYISE